MDLRVKMITGHESQYIEGEVNNWLAAQKDIHIVQILQSECPSWTTISIFYEGNSLNLEEEANGQI